MNRILSGSLSYYIRSEVTFKHMIHNEYRCRALYIIKDNRTYEPKWYETTFNSFLNYFYTEQSNKVALDNNGPNFKTQRRGKVFSIYSISFNHTERECTIIILGYLLLIRTLSGCVKLCDLEHKDWHPVQRVITSYLCN